MNAEFDVAFSVAERITGAPHLGRGGVACALAMWDSLLMGYEGRRHLDVFCSLASAGDDVGKPVNDVSHTHASLNLTGC